MSYCVNCGVELDETLVKCPLCDCPVINPMKSGSAGVAPLHPRQVEHIDNLPERRFAALIITIIALFVSIICITIDLSYSRELEWSRYVLASIGLIWIFVTGPLFSQKMGPMMGIAIDSAAVALFLYGIESWSMPGKWFLPLAFPIIGTAFFYHDGGRGVAGQPACQGTQCSGADFFRNRSFCIVH